jgi:hypothetical protein
MHLEPVLFLPLACACIEILAGSADLLTFGGVGGGWAPDLLFWLPVYDRAKMRPVYALIVGLTEFYM